MMNKQTTLDLNGPILSFTENVVGVATSGGSVTITGLATATFPTQTPTNPATNTGSIAYRWHEVGIGSLSDTSTISGSGTTSLTISGLTTPQGNGRQFYLIADYVASAYQSSTPVTAGTARSTGNALVEPLESNVGIVTVFPQIEIIAQPSNTSTIVDTNITFTIDAGLTDTSSTGISYQWLVNGDEVSDGTITKVLTYQQTYTANNSVTLPSDASDVTLTVAGAAGGAGGSDAGGPGGSGGAGRQITVTLPDGARTLSFEIGKRGNGGSSGNSQAYGNGGASDVAAGGRGGGAGNSGWSGGGGGGGGATGVKSGNDLIVVAGGGGGGGGGSWNRSATSGTNAGTFNGVSDIDDVSNGSQGSDKGGGDGGGGGGGGGGANGAASGGGSGTDNSDGGKGGSGGQSEFDNNVITSSSAQTTNTSDGFVLLSLASDEDIDNIPSSTTRETTLSGTQSDTLTIKSDTVGIQTVQCKITHPTASNSPVFSDTVNFTVLNNADQFNINIEAIGVDSTASLTSINLFNGDHEFETSLSNTDAGKVTNYYSVYSPDKDIDVEMDLYGGKGVDDPTGGVGGEGGFSRIRFTMEQNVEYVVAGLTTSINAPFVYRKGKLIACVGGGGEAGNSSAARGGFGGGIGISGSDGAGLQSGGVTNAITAGNLPTTGIFGSIVSISNPSPDSQASTPDGGRTLTCPRGVYWRQQGLSACSDISGSTKFRLSNGTQVTNTASIARGYKAGYDIIQTAGAGENGGGNGGAGAVGGSGGGFRSGGSGGSGYTDGSVTVESTQLGGSTGNARVILRVVT